MPGRLPGRRDLTVNRTRVRGVGVSLQEDDWIQSSVRYYLGEEQLARKYKIYKP